MKTPAKRVKPWSSFTSADATAANFPCLKHFFPCEDGAGTYGLRDVVGGVEFAEHTFTVPESHAIKTTYANEAVGHNLQLKTGVWNIDRSLPTLALVCVKNQQPGGYFSIGIGDSVPFGEEIVFSSGFYLLAMNSGGVNLATPSGVTIGNTLPTMVGAFFTPGDSMTGVYTDTSGAYAAQTPQSLATMPLAPNYSAYGSLSGQQMEALYGIAVFQFESAFPTDIAEAIEWMRAEWARGHKTIYPRWIGVR